MEKRAGSTRILICKAEERRFGLFDSDIERIKRYSDKALHSLGNGGEDQVIRNFREYLSIPVDMYGERPILIRPNEGKDLLTVDSIWKKCRVKAYNIFPTRFDYIKEVLIDNERIPVFQLPDLLQIHPPLDSKALESVKKGVVLKGDAGVQYGKEGHGEREYGTRGNIDQAGEETEAALETEPENDGGMPHRGISRGGAFTYVLMSLSLALLIALGIFIIKSGNLDGLWHVSYPGSKVTTRTPTHVLSYLTHRSRLQVQQNAYELLQKEKAGLEKTERELLALETEKNNFLRNIEERNAAFDEHVSVFDVDESNKELSSVVDFVRNKVTFKGEVKRRTDQFLKLYETRKQSLLALKRGHGEQIKQLTALIQDVQTDAADEQISEGQPLYLEEVKTEQLNRFVFLFEKGDYAGARETLERVAVLPFSREEQMLHLLVGRLVAILSEYDERMTLLRKNDPFNDIKLSYINEDYAATLRKVQTLQQEDYIRPLLGGMESGLYENMDIERQLQDNIELRRKVDELAGRASRLEKNGEYDKAVDAYESLLTLPLPSYDREHILNQVHALWLHVELMRLKRIENTKAIKYLESARILNREGNETGAIEYYKMLLMECPHSDFVGDAVDEIMKLQAL